MTYRLLLSPFNRWLSHVPETAQKGRPRVQVQAAWSRAHSLNHCRHPSPGATWGPFAECLLSSPCIPPNHEGNCSLHFIGEEIGLWGWRLKPHSRWVAILGLKSRSTWQGSRAHIDCAHQDFVWPEARPHGSASAGHRGWCIRPDGKRGGSNTSSQLLGPESHAALPVLHCPKLDTPMGAWATGQRATLYT